MGLRNDTLDLPLIRGISELINLTMELEITILREALFASLKSPRLQ